jgi:hypothetical protein
MGLLARIEIKTDFLRSLNRKTVMQKLWQKLSYACILGGILQEVAIGLWESSTEALDGQIARILSWYNAMI